MTSPRAESIVHGLTATAVQKESTGATVDDHIELIRSLPSVDATLKQPAFTALFSEYGSTLVKQELRAELAEMRGRVLSAGSSRVTAEIGTLADTVARRCADRTSPKMRRVLNLTGTVIHTNLGRAVLSECAIDHVSRVMRGNNNLEYDLDTGSRGDRDSIVESLLCELTGAEAATVVNNNAAAVLLTIAALAGGKEAIVSRGELVEIGGAFRMPDVMASAGAKMIEVGTTNRTHLADYKNAITPNTGLLMKVHTSNYAVTGFTSSVPENDLAKLAAERGIPLATDLGSGSLLSLEQYGLPHEPTPQEMIEAGCDVVTFSGDKLLGGPQAGLIVGKKAAIQRIRKFPMKRALRMSKLPLAALEATLRLYLKPELLRRDLPTLRHLTRSHDDVTQIALMLQTPLADALNPYFDVSVVPSQSQIGSGSLPIDRIDSASISIRSGSIKTKTSVSPHMNRASGRYVETLATLFRELPIPMIGRLQDNTLLFDCRCVDHTSAITDQLSQLKAAVASHPHFRTPKSA